MNARPLNELETIDAETEEVNVIFETPQGHRNKYKYEAALHLFKLGKVLPAGMVFPYDFGFIPSTLGEDGDPLDSLVLMDEPVFPGNLATARLIGAIEAEQTQEGKTKRNDRLIAVATECHQFKNVKELADLGENLISQIEHFFVSYNEMEGKQFKPIGRANSGQAWSLLKTGQKRFAQHKRRGQKPQ